MNKILYLFLSVLILSSVTTAQQNILILENEFLSAGNDPLKNNSVSFLQENGKKNTALAILYSLLLPGMGELYAGSYESGKYFTIAEGVLWGTFIGMNAYGNWQQDRYKSFAESDGQVNLNGKDEEYFAIIGAYQNIDEYNNEKALERNFDEMFDVQKYYWNWASNDKRKTYRDLWESSEQTFNDVRFVVGALIINRVVSIINAVRLISAYNNQAVEQISWDLSVGVENKINLPKSLSLKFRAEF
ncbi:MAG: hypothetical protein Kow0098_13610 [Ignavibacteriaceae bacterium]